MIAVGVASSDSIKAESTLSSLQRENLINSSDSNIKDNENVKIKNNKDYLKIKLEENKESRTTKNSTYVSCNATNNESTPALPTSSTKSTMKTNSRNESTINTLISKETSSAVDSKCDSSETTTIKNITDVKDSSRREKKKLQEAKVSSCTPPSCSSNVTATLEKATNDKTKSQNHNQLGLSSLSTSAIPRRKRIFSIDLDPAGFDFESSMAVTFTTPNSPLWKGETCGPAGDLPPIASLSSTNSDSNPNDSKNDSNNSTTDIDDTLPILTKQEEGNHDYDTSRKLNNNVDIVIDIQSRDRQMSFELSAFVYKDHDDDVDMDLVMDAVKQEEDEEDQRRQRQQNEHSSSSVQIKEEEHRKDKDDTVDSSIQNVTKNFRTRPRGDSIIFDPVSFSDGGIHEANALLRSPAVAGKGGRAIVYCFEENDEIEKLMEHPDCFAEKQSSSTDIHSNTKSYHNHVFSPDPLSEANHIIHNNPGRTTEKRNDDGDKVLTGYPSTSSSTTLAKSLPNNPIKAAPTKKIDKHHSNTISSNCTTYSSADILSSSNKKTTNSNHSNANTITSVVSRHHTPTLTVVTSSTSGILASNNKQTSINPTNTEFYHLSNQYQHKPASVSTHSSSNLPTQIVPSSLHGTLPLTTCPMELLNKGGRIGIYLPAARKARIAKFHSKRKLRIWRKRIKYDCRKKLADSRPRIKGRFVKRTNLNGDEEE